jgi:hypothetical protein
MTPAAALAQPMLLLGAGANLTPLGGWFMLATAVHVWPWSAVLRMLGWPLPAACPTAMHAISGDDVDTYETASMLSLALSAGTVVAAVHVDPPLVV